MRPSILFRPFRSSGFRAGLAVASCVLVLSCDLFDSKKSTPPKESQQSKPVVLAPSIAPQAGNTVSASPIDVSIASPTPGAWVCWSVDGTEPVDGGRCADTARFVLDSSSLVKARAYHDGHTPSAIVEKRYLIDLPKAPTPRLTPDSGYFDTAVAVAISTESFGAGWEIHYTTDGTIPTAHSARYQGPFRLGHDAVVKARLWIPSRKPSEVVSGRFVFARSSGVSPKPRISPRDTLLDTSVAVVIAPAQAGCEIRYTTDSTEPTQWSRQSFGQILLERSARVKARAWCQDLYGAFLEPSATDSVDIVIRYKPARPPVFSPAEGIYDSVKYVELSTQTPGAIIRYTIDGRDPSPSSAIYAGPITVRTTTTIKAVAYASDRPASAVAKATFTLRNVPVSGRTKITGRNEASSTWSGDTVVRVSIQGPGLAGTTVRYTLDGSDPTEASPLYRETFVVDGPRVVKARSFRRGMLESEIDSLRFSPRLSRATKPVFSPDTAAYSRDSVQYIYLSTKTPGCQIRYTLDGTEPTSGSALYGGAPLVLEKTTTVKAIALAWNREASRVASATWTLGPLSAGATSITTTALPEGGVYRAIVPLAMGTSTPEATIRYTLDGKDPTESSPVFPGLLTLESSDTVKARAFRRGLLAGPVATMEVRIRLVPCDTVDIRDSLSGPGGFRTVRLSTRTDSAQIWYGFGDGGYVPYPYGTPIQLTSTTKIHAVARKYGRAESPLSARVVEVRLPVAPRPRLAPRDTTAGDVVQVSISDSLPGATLWYSRYGYDRTRYTGPFEVEDSVTRVVAWAEATGYARSANDTVVVRVSLPGAGAVRHLLAQGIYGSVKYDTIVADSGSATVWVSLDNGAFSAFPGGRAVVRLDHYARVRAYATMAHRLKGATSTAWYDIRLPKSPKPAIQPRGGFSDTVVKATIATTDGYSTWYRLGTGSANGYSSGQILNISSSSVLTAWNTAPDHLASDVDSASYVVRLRPVDTLLADKPAGYYDTGLVVRLSTATKGATIWVRLENGASGSSFRALDSSGRIRIDSSSVLYAYATADGRAPSETIQARYDVRRYAAPMPARRDTLGSTYLATRLAGAQVFYQMDGGSVRTTGASTPLPLPAGSHVVTSWTARAGWISSPLRLDTIRVVPSAPTINPKSGSFPSGTVVSIRSPEGLPVRWSVDGKDPSTGSSPWMTDIVIDSLVRAGDSIVLKARVWADSVPSALATAVLRRMARVAPVLSGIPDTTKLDTGVATTLRSSTGGSTVWWRLVGTGVYKGSADSVRFALDSSMTVEAYATKEGMEPSAVSVFSWSIPRYGVATPSISPRDTVRDSSALVSIRTSTPKAQIWYMVDATGPFAYSEPFRIAKNVTVTAYATRPGWNRSALDSVWLVFAPMPVAKPVFSPDSGATIDSGAKVSIQAAAGAVIRYTLDGTDPTTASPVYTVPLSINAPGVVLKARAWQGERSGAVATARYNLASRARFNVWMQPHGGAFTDSVAVAIRCEGCSDTTLLFSSFGRDTIEALANARAQNPFEAMVLRSSGKAWLLLVGLRSKAILSWDSATFAIGRTLAKSEVPSLRRADSGIAVRNGDTLRYQDSIRLLVSLGGRGDVVHYRNLCVDSMPTPVATGSVKFAAAGTCGALFWTRSDTLTNSDTVRLVLVGTSSEVTPPKFSPPSGTIPAGSKIAISGPSGAVIHYTFDGTFPTLESPLYAGPISVDVDNVTLKARAWVGERSSVLSTGTYRLAPIATFNVWMKPHGGTFTDSAAASISCSGCSDSTILYSSVGRTQEEALLNARGQNPSENLAIRSSGTAWLLLMGKNSRSILAWDTASFSIVPGKLAAPAILRDSNVVLENGQIVRFQDSIRLIATKAQLDALAMYDNSCRDKDSIVPRSGTQGGKWFSDSGTCLVKFWTLDQGGIRGSDTIRITLVGTKTPIARPTFTPDSGSSVAAGSGVTITGPAGAVIRYTLDGKDPTTSSPVYSAPVPIANSDVVLKARAWIGTRVSEVTIGRFGVVRPTPPLLVRWGGGLGGFDTLTSERVIYHDTLQIMVKAEKATDTVWEVDRCTDAKAKPVTSVYHDGIWRCDADFYSTRNGASSDTIRLNIYGSLRAPQFALDKPGTYTDSAKVALVPSSPYWGVAYSIDGGAWQTYKSPFLVRKSALISARAYVGSDSGDVDTGRFTIVPSAQDTLLQSLSVTSGVLSPSFNNAVLSYRDTITTDTMTITAIPRTPAVSKVWIDGVQQGFLGVYLKEGQSRTVRVVVKSSRDSLVYTVALFRKAYDPTFGIPWNSAITYGTLADARDGKTYKTVRIGTLTWMAENLNYKGDGPDTGYCYANSQDSCAKYGRLYTWSTVMAEAASSTKSPSGVKGICPDGWHVPSDNEWMIFEVAVGLSASDAAAMGWRGTLEATKLKSTSGWYNSENGTDNYGFRVLPAGQSNPLGGFDAGIAATFWTATESEAAYAYRRWLNYGQTTIHRANPYKTFGYSLRCVADYAPAPQDTTLASLTVSNGTLSPTFNASVLSYRDTFTTASTTISAIARDPAVSKIWIDGVQRSSLEVPLTGGASQTVRVVVRSTDKDSLVYTVELVHKQEVVDPTFGIPWNSSITYGTLTDARDGKSYRTVRIGTLTWMAENLNYKGPGADSGWAYKNNPDSAAKYGRWYTWNTAMAGASSSTGSPSGVRGICPENWHLPSKEEWRTLGTGSENVKLKSSAGWGSQGNGTDAYGFRVLPAGLQTPYGSNVGIDGFMWSATEQGASTAWWRDMIYDIDYQQSFFDKSYGLSVRCVADYVIPAQDTTLASLTVSSGTLSPAFHASVLSYRDTFTTASTTISAIARDPAVSKIWIDGVQRNSLEVPLTGGQSQTVRVVVRSTDNDSLVYTVELVHKPAVVEIPWNSAITYGTLSDARDGNTYKTVKIGTQTWMAENLNYTGKGTVGSCYDQSSEACAKFGRLYNWAETMDTTTSYNWTLLKLSSRRQGICPDGWRVPSDSDWGDLAANIGGETAGLKLKSTAGWIGSSNGTDDYGFRVLPAGSSYFSARFENIDSLATFWSTSEYDALQVKGRSLGTYGDDFSSKAAVKGDYRSVRCLKNDM